MHPPPPPLVTPGRPLFSVIVRELRGRRGLQLEVIDLHGGERLVVESLDDLWQLLRRLAPGLR